MLILKIVSPERVEFDGEVGSVTLPGTLGSFEVLTGHAPIISSLEKGKVEWTILKGEKFQLNVSGGFAEVQKDIVSVCIEVEMQENV